MKNALIYLIAYFGFLFPSVPILPEPAVCAVRAATTRGPNELNMYRVTISIPPNCPASSFRLARLITPNGGRVPPLGYFKLGGGSPRTLERWIFKYTRVQDRAAPNVWADVQIQGAKW